MDFERGDEVRVVGPAILLIGFMGHDDNLGDPQGMTDRTGRVLAVWREWVAVRVQGAANSWWFIPASLERLTER